VRELRNVLERAMLTMSGKEIRSEDLLLESETGAMVKTSGGLPTADWEIRPLDDIVADYVSASVGAAGGQCSKSRAATADQSIDAVCADEEAVACQVPNRDRHAEEVRRRRKRMPARRRRAPAR